ncbi:MAG: MATE family efflux transporter [Faecalibacterium sp.]
MLQAFRKKYIGNQTFYKMIFVLVLPLVIQQGITNFVTLLDNVMVGALGTQQLNSVAIVNQLIFVFNLAIFGAVSGVSIFGAQFYGKGDTKGMCHTLRIKLYAGLICAVLCIVLLKTQASSLVGLFLDESTNDAASLAATLEYAMSYIDIVVWGLIPFMVVQSYTSTLRETGDTVAPMYGSLIAICINLTGNYLLIFGMFGFPQLGVAGAAVATVLARWVETIYVVLYAHRSTARYPFFGELYRSFHVPADLLKKVSIVGMPLLFNEVLYSIGITFVNQNYSTRGLSVVAAVNITTTAWQLFCVIMFAMGNAVSILVGQQLGAGEIEEAKAVDNKLLFFTVSSHLVIGLLIIAAAPFIPLLYNTEPEVRQLATNLLMIAGAALPIHAYTHVAYFTIRSGGKTFITFLFDSVYTWVVSVSISFILCRYTALPVLACYAAVQFADIIKVFIAYPMLKSGFWANNVIEEKTVK